VNRRNFLFGLGATVAGIAIEQAIPFGRVWSFPQDIKINTGGFFGDEPFLTLAAFPQIAYDHLAILEWQANTPFIELLNDYRPMPRRSARSMQLYHGWPAPRTGVPA
jgi:hypothetical protein